MRRDRHTTRGFTLVEVLVALTLLGLIGVMLSDGLRFGARAWERTRDSSASLSDIAATQNFLRRRLEGPTREAGFGGETGWMTVEALWMADLGAGAFNRLVLAHYPDATPSGALVLSWEPAEEDGGEPDPTLSGSRVLLDGVQAFAIRYFGALPPDETPRWHAAWPTDAGRPALVRVDLRFFDPRRQWPPLVAAPGH